MTFINFRDFIFIFYLLGIVSAEEIYVLEYQKRNENVLTSGNIKYNMLLVFLT